MASHTLNGGELISAEPRDELALEQQAGHALRQNLQHFVARAVPAKVVDLLEPIEIDGDQGDFAPPLAGETISRARWSLKLARLGKPVRLSLKAIWRSCR